MKDKSLFILLLFLVIIILYPKLTRNIIKQKKKPSKPGKRTQRVKKRVKKLFRIRSSNPISPEDINIKLD